MTDRKKDHIELAFASQAGLMASDKRFYYEPMLSAHPGSNSIPETNFLGKTMKIPLWVSSMTGGTKLAETINTNLAKACREFGLGMGLGSCRIIIDDDTWFKQFDMRPIIGDDLPLYANLGIAQVQRLLNEKAIDKLLHLIDRLKADGLIVHVNPLQEFFQPEGDLLTAPAIDSINQLTEITDIKIIVKEVGQGMGPASLISLLKSDIHGIEFGAYGGTNFARVELIRDNGNSRELFAPLANVGHTAAEMLDYLNKNISSQNQKNIKSLIISGGINNFLDGYYLIRKSSYPAVYGQASTFLKYAREGYETLHAYISHQIKGLQLAYSFLRLNESDNEE